MENLNNKKFTAIIDGIETEGKILTEIENGTTFYYLAQNDKDGVSPSVSILHEYKYTWYIGTNILDVSDFDVEELRIIDEPKEFRQEISVPQFGNYSK